MGDFAGQKPAFFAGHSAQVAGLAASAAGRPGLPGAERRALRFAALAHDLGRVGISAAIWDKPGRLTGGEWESVRLHAYYSERMPVKVPALAGAAGRPEPIMSGATARGITGAAAPSPCCPPAAASSIAPSAACQRFGPTG